MMGNGSSSDRIGGPGLGEPERQSRASTSSDAAALVVERVTLAEIRLIYPLMMMAEPGLDLRHWMRFATRLIRRRDGRTGVLAARRHVKRFPSGAVCFREAQDLRHGTVLLAEHFVVVDPIDPQTVLQALSRELDLLARTLGCRAVRVLAPNGAHSVELQQAGHGGEGVVLLKAVLPEGDVG